MTYKPNAIAHLGFVKSYKVYRTLPLNMICDISKVILLDELDGNW